MSSFTRIPSVRLLENGEWETCESFFFYFEDPNGKKIDVPRGFATDFASIPRVFWVFVSPTNPRWAKSAILHDFIYEKKPINPTTEKIFTREEADILFYEGCIILGTPKWLAKIFYWAVRGFGWVYWND